MKDMNINTLHIYERLKKARASEAVSREIADIIGSLVDDKLATKSDTLLLQNNLKKTESSLQNELKLTESRLQNELKQTESRLQNDLKQTELRLQTEIAKSKSETIKWIIGWVTGLVIAQTGIFMAFLKLSF